VNDINPTTINLKNRIAHLAPLVALLALVAGCAGYVEETIDNVPDVGTAEEPQTWGGPGIPMPKKRIVDPGDTVEWIDDVQCEVTVPPSVSNVRGAAGRGCSRQASEYCQSQRRSGHKGVALYTTATNIACEGRECTGLGVVQCLFNTADDS
jgi:hypothetical protein